MDSTPSTAGYSRILNQGLRLFFSELFRVSLRHPSQALHFLRVVLWQRSAARVRNRQAAAGLHVPPIAIFSITNKCNLRCKGCYAQAIRGDAPDALTENQVRSIIAQATDLGISFFVIAGGEPLMRPEFLAIAAAFPKALFLLATNGTLLDATMIGTLAAQKNTVPLLSLEGNQAQTDDRRGSGVYKALRERMTQLREAGVFFSLALTVTRPNFRTLTDTAFIADAVGAGCKFFLFLEYTPVREGTEDWVITDEQRAAMKGLLLDLKRTHNAVFIGVPWDEEESGGCLAAGRGFVHISAEGKLEPCPFAPYSDTDLRALPLAQGLKSRLLQSLRDHHDQFAETSGGCALWKNREAVRAMVNAFAAK